MSVAPICKVGAVLLPSHGVAARIRRGRQGRPGPAHVCTDVHHSVLRCRPLSALPFAFLDESGKRMVGWLVCPGGPRFLPLGTWGRLLANTSAQGGKLGLYEPPAWGRAGEHGSGPGVWFREYGPATVPALSCGSRPRPHSRRPPHHWEEDTGHPPGCQALRPDRAATAPRVPTSAFQRALRPPGASPREDGHLAHLLNTGSCGRALAHFHPS